TATRAWCSRTGVSSRPITQQTPRRPRPTWCSAGATPVHKPKILVLGRMCEEPVAGVVWQVLHYLVGLDRLGFDVYYVEWRGNWLPHPTDPAIDAEWPRVMVGNVLREYGFGGRWICRADCVGAGC